MSGDRRQAVDSDGEELRDRFPDPETDERLNHRPVLPNPPRPMFQRPSTRPQSQSGLAPQRIEAQDIRGMGLAMSVGTSLVASILSGLLLGGAADRYLVRKETPYGLLVGLVLGVVAGFVSVARTVALIDKSDRDARRK